jgi:hypothetical protein
MSTKYKNADVNKINEGGSFHPAGRWFIHIDRFVSELFEFRFGLFPIQRKSITKNGILISKLSCHEKSVGER